MPAHPQLALHRYAGKQNALVPQLKPPVLRTVSMYLPAYASNSLYASSSARSTNNGKYNTEYRAAGLGSVRSTIYPGEAPVQSPCRLFQRFVWM